MSIQGLMQKGLQNCSKLEKAADILLVFPRVIWLKRNINVIVSGNDSQINDRKASSVLTSKGWHQDNYGLPLVLVVGSIIATPFLAIGLALKKISFANNEKSKSYHQLIENQIKLGSLKKKIDKLTIKARIANPELILNYNNMWNQIALEVKEMYKDDEKKLQFVDRVFYQRRNLPEYEVKSRKKIFDKHMAEIEKLTQKKESIEKIISSLMSSCCSDK